MASTVSGRLASVARRPLCFFCAATKQTADGPVGGPDGDTVPPSSARLRTALTVFFALDGFLFAGWVVRIPAIKHQTGASASTLGLALLGVSAGAVITMMLAGGSADGSAATP